jgi:hypothetical protein
MKKIYQILFIFILFGIISCTSPDESNKTDNHTPAPDLSKISSIKLFAVNVPREIWTGSYSQNLNIPSNYDFVSDTVYYLNDTLYFTGKINQNTGYNVNGKIVINKNNSDIIYFFMYQYNNYTYYLWDKVKNQSVLMYESNSWINITCKNFRKEPPETLVYKINKQGNNNDLFLDSIFSDSNGLKLKQDNI